MTVGVEVVTPGDEAVRAEVSPLWTEYWEISRLEVVDLVGFDIGTPDEVAHENEDPAAHCRAVLLARVDGDAVGSAGLAHVDDQSCELKRLYVRSHARRHGVAAALVAAAADEAPRLGYHRILADTLVSRTGALEMFRRAGFVEIEPWRENALPMVYQALDL